MTASCYSAMSTILQYFARKQVGSLPNPEGTFSNVIPSAAIKSANSEVNKVMWGQGNPSSRVSLKETRKGKMCRVYSLREQAGIGKLACSIGATAAARRISRNWFGGTSINESTVRGFKKAYLNELHSKKLREEEDLTVQELPFKKRGRPLLLGKKLDEAVQQYILKLREHGCPINTVIVLAVARGIVKSMDRTRLEEYGGSTMLTVPWSKSLLKRMNFIKR